MIAGVLEIQMMANMARLSKDMNEATRVVSDSTDKMAKSVTSVKDKMASLGMGLSIGFIADSTRRMVDAYTKLNAQIELSTKSQESYNTALADIRRISTIAQSDINATTMLYTRLMNVMDGTGVSQQKLATVTETVSYGLKAYGATSAEAASAALQLSQAMGANRLGGEEFRAVMEAMPNVMKVLADSMGVPLGELRALSMAGKITAEEMVKAFGNPAIAEQFRLMAMNAQTITGAFVTAKNELTLLVGEFARGSGVSGALITALNGIGGVLNVVTKYVDDLIMAFTAYSIVAGGRLVAAMVAARAATIAKTQATIAETAATLAAARVNQAYTGSLAQVAAAQAAHSAASIGWFGRLKNSVGKGGLVGLALFGILEVVNILDGLDAVGRKGRETIDGLAKRATDMTMAQLVQARQLAQVELSVGKRNPFTSAKTLADAETAIRTYDLQIERVKALEVATRAASGASGKFGATGVVITHDDMVLLGRYNKLVEQLNEKTLTQAEFAQRVQELYNGKKTPAVKAAMTEQEKLAAAIQDTVDAAEKELATYGMTANQIKVYEAAMQGASNEQMIQIVAIYDKIAAMDDEKKASEELADFLAKLEQRKKSRQFDREAQAAKEIADMQEKELKRQQRAWERFTGTVASNMGDVLFKGATDGFKGMGDAFKQLTLRMAADAAAANLTQYLFGSTKGGGALGGFASKVLDFFPSFAGGGSTGIGSRSGGVDGMGGFPAILHPNETVVDHSAGQTASQPSVTVVQNINIDSRSDQATIMAAMQRSAQMAETSIMNSLQRGGAFARAVGRA